MKNMIRNSVIVLASVFAINAAQAESDGGLMAEMMAKKFPAQVITEPAVQAHLAQVKLPAETHQNGGLMAEMMAARFPAKVIDDPSAQERLALVKIPVSSGNGGLRVEMQQQHEELKAANIQRAEKIDARG